MNTPEMEKLIYWYFKESSLVIVPKVSGNNWWLDTEADPMIWKNTNIKMKILKISTMLSQKK